MKTSILLLLLFVGAACSEWPIGQRELPGTYVMNRGRAADTLILESTGRYSRIYGPRDQRPTIDTGTWVMDTLHGTVYVAFASFWERWRDEIDVGGVRRRPIAAGPWRAPLTRTLAGRVQLVVDPDIDWAYAQRRQTR